VVKCSHGGLQPPNNPTKHDMTGRLASFSGYKTIEFSRPLFSYTSLDKIFPNFERRPAQNIYTRFTRHLR